MARTFRRIKAAFGTSHSVRALVEEGMDLDQLPKESVFATSTITTTTIAPPSPSSEDRLSISKFLDDVGAGHRNKKEAKVLVGSSVAEFGAQ